MFVILEFIFIHPVHRSKYWFFEVVMLATPLGTKRVIIVFYQMFSLTAITVEAYGCVM
jgi:hypothetical protein